MDKKKRAFSESCSGKGGFFLMADVIGDNETGKGSLWYARELYVIHPRPPGADTPLPLQVWIRGSTIWIRGESDSYTYTSADASVYGIL